MDQEHELVSITCSSRVLGCNAALAETQLLGSRLSVFAAHGKA
jgi:hypothetical protein